MSVTRRAKSEWNETIVELRFGITYSMLLDFTAVGLYIKKRTSGEIRRSKAMSIYSICRCQAQKVSNLLSSVSKLRCSPNGVLVDNFGLLDKIGEIPCFFYFTFHPGCTDACCALNKLKLYKLHVSVFSVSLCFSIWDDTSLKP